MPEFDEFYKAPVVTLSELDAFTPSLGDDETIYELEIGDGMLLSFLVNCRPSIRGEIRTGFHAAKGPITPDGRYFAPVALSRASNAPFVLFSDPTLSLAPKNRLSWYLGTPDVDPDNWMEAIIRKLMGVVGARYLILEGSSAGGFVAMRLGARFANSVAIPRIPQTDIFRYSIRQPVRESLNTAWSGLSYVEIMKDYSHRFRIADLYTDPCWNRGNLISYVHNAGDTWHTEEHLNPFLEEIGESVHAFVALEDRMTVSRPYVGVGHVGIPSSFWPAETEMAFTRLRTCRPLETNHSDEPMFSSPREMRRSSAANEARQRSISQHWASIPG
ncbi:hypothetical protein M1E17_14710 [Arthrobacter sp. D1-29]